MEAPAFSKAAISQCSQSAKADSLLAPIAGGGEFTASGVSEGLISKWHNNILRTFGMKIIGHDGRVTAVLEGQYDS